jgi:hypothetical protein
MTSAEKMQDFETRVHQFITLELPGQPRMMHMGTSNLVSELWAEVKNLRSQLEAQRGAESVARPMRDYTGPVTVIPRG